MSGRICSSSLATLLAVSIVHLGSVVVNPAKESPKDLLRKVLEGKPAVALSSIQFQRQQGMIGPTKVRVEQDPAGRTRRTVLEPSKWSGVVSYDNGRTLMTVNPREREVIVQSSPMRAKMPVDERLELIGRNYRLSFEPTSAIAGRSTRCIVATPLRRELYTRRYYVDAEAQVVLRFQTVTSAGSARTLLDTESVTVTTSVADLDRLPPSEGYRVFKVPPPVAVNNPKSVVDVVGFVPRIPTSLPYGFVVYEVHLLGDRHDGQFIGARLTDGLATATVYQWDSKVRKRFAPSRDQRHVRDSLGVWYSAVGDVPEAVRARLLETFLKAAESEMYGEEYYDGELQFLPELLELVRRLVVELQSIAPSRAVTG
jgi:hypothetical protein